MWHCMRMRHAQSGFPRSCHSYLSSVERCTFTNVEIGRTYYVGERDANGVNFVSGVMAGNVAYAAGLQTATWRP
ncbi:MAG: hypothetical protein ACLTSZ_19705 [Lachnospiraceae bacterium]